ncbi:MAG: type VI secretion system baseplate subunit TssK [Proteobacteria bacterium]|nr:type VI secretion system baseplate subunit TssK [Pseudomonadota bacterium]
MQSLKHAFDAIQWYEGMLIAPQHFQQHSVRYESLMCRYLRAAQPFFWGISAFTIDRVLLVSGKLSILELDAILPDGTVLTVTEENNYIPQIDLTVYNDEFRKGPLMIYLGVPFVNPNGSNLTGDFPRYLSIPGEPCVDLNTGENPIYIPRIVPNINLLVGNIPPPQYVNFPLIEIEFVNESYQQTSFLPPQTFCSRTSILGQVIANILQHLKDKAAFLSENLQTNAPTAQPLILQYEELLKIIVRQIPILDDLLGTNITHPYRLYQALLSLAGDLTTLKRGQVAPLFTPYQHNSIFQSFDQVVSFVISMIEIIQENYSALPFGQCDRVFSIELPSQVSDPTFLVSLRGTPTFGSSDLVDWLGGTIIASESFLKNVRDRRILGSSRQVIENDSDFGISPPQNGLLVTITNDPEFIKSGEPLCLINLMDSPETRPQGIILYTKKT